MHIEIEQGPLRPWVRVADYEAGQAALPGKVGASAVFVGTMRDFNQGRDVSGMVLEHYPGMTERHLEAVAAEAVTRWQLLDALIIHRVGAIAPAEPIVVVAAWSGHRQQAFEAARYMIDELKTRAPLWKRESTPEGECWVAPGKG